MSPKTVTLAGAHVQGENVTNDGNIKNQFTRAMRAHYVKTLPKGNYFITNVTVQPYNEGE